MISPDNFPEADQTLVKQLAAKYLKNLDYQLYIFGSRSKQDPCKSYSDLDLVINSATPIERSLLFQFEEALEESGLNYRVDVMDWQRISDSFRNTIEKELKAF